MPRLKKPNCEARVPKQIPMGNRLQASDEETGVGLLSNIDLRVSGFVSGIFLMFLVVSAFGQRTATVDAEARFLAGLPVSGALEPLTESQAWQEHAAAMNEAWMKKDYFQIGPITAWMTANAYDHYQSSDTMFYMFGGPDFLYANVFFPNAKTYILAGLEPVGQVPDLLRQNPETLGRELPALRASMKTILNTHYFITKDMRTDLERGGITGTLPILYVFLARRGCNVVETTFLKDPAEGVKITFDGKVARQTLYYFKTDLSGGKSKFLSWCAKQGPGVSLLKAASYLMHGEGFSGVRNFLLEHSRVIIQDDSGIPLKAFPKGWSVNCYGRYVPHKEMFDKFHQADLAAINDKNPSPPELGFAFGYHWQIDRGILMMATKKSEKTTDGHE